MENKFYFTAEEGLCIKDGDLELLSKLDAHNFDCMGRENGCQNFRKLKEDRSIIVHFVRKIEDRKKTVKIPTRHSSIVRANINALINELVKSNKVNASTQSLLGLVDGLKVKLQLLERIENHNGSIDIENRVLGYYQDNTITLEYSEDSSELLASTYVHEMMHAIFDHGQGRTFEYVEEPLAELGMLQFLESFAQCDDSSSAIFSDALAAVEKKQKTPGLIHYGYGAWLFQTNMFKEFMPNPIMSYSEFLRTNQGHFTSIAKMVDYSEIEERMSDIQFPTHSRRLVNLANRMHYLFDDRREESSGLRRREW